MRSLGSGKRMHSFEFINGCFAFANLLDKSQLNEFLCRIYKMVFVNIWLCAWEEIRTEFVQNSGEEAADGAR